MGFSIILCYNILMMEIQRTITILFEDDPDLRETLYRSRELKQAISPIAFNDGKPLGAIALQRKCYHNVKGKLNSQMTISAIRQVSGAYASAKRRKRRISKPFEFRRANAVFLIGRRGRDADFRQDGTLSIWTVAGRKRLRYHVPEAFQTLFQQAKEYDSLNVIERDGKLLGRLTITLEVPKPAGIHPVGIDLNETNALVAIDVDEHVLFISGKEVKVKNRRTQKTRARLQKKLAARKAEGKDTRSVRRVLKRLGRKQKNRTRTFAQTIAKQLVQWAPQDSVLVLEDLRMPQVTKNVRQRPGIRRRLNQWPHGMMRTWIRNKAKEAGILVEIVDPRNTSQVCSRCGLKGIRKKHSFTCSSCGFEDHADINAARNIRNRFTVLRGSGLSSTSPEARSAGKPPVLAGGS